MEVVWVVSALVWSSIESMLLVTKVPEVTSTGVEGEEVVGVSVAITTTSLRVEDNGNVAPTKAKTGEISLIVETK